MTIIRTANGYALGHWEGIPMSLPDGGKLTPCEMRAAVCKANGLTQAEAAVEMHCSKNNVNQAWSNIYYKLRCNRAAVALGIMIDLGALRRLIAILLIITAGSAGCDDLWRSCRSRNARGGTRSFSKRAAARMAGSTLLLGMLQQLDQLTGAGDCYTAADLAPTHPWGKTQAWFCAAHREHIA